MNKRSFYDACMILDRLQVELCDDTPYETPSASETRERILEVMECLDKCGMDESRDEVIIVTTAHAVPEDEFLHADGAVFTSEDEARRHFAAQRLSCIEMLRQEDDDWYEETRDVSVRDFDDVSVGVCHDDGEMYQVRLVRKSLMQP